MHVLKTQRKLSHSSLAYIWHSHGAFWVKKVGVYARMPRLVDRQTGFVWCLEALEFYFLFFKDLKNPVLNWIMGLVNKGWYGMFVACGIWCLADYKHNISTFVDQTHIQHTRPRRKTVLFKTILPIQCWIELDCHPWKSSRVCNQIYVAVSYWFFLTLKVKLTAWKAVTYI